MKRSSILLLAVVIVFFCGMLIFGAMSVPGVTKIIFPETFPEPPPGPEETLRAPFATDSTATGQGTTARQVSLDQPHRRQEDLAEWLTQTISEILTMDPETEETTEGAEASDLDYRANMTPEAREQFEGFLTKSRILDMLSANDMRLMSYIEEVPLLLNEGNVGGRYRWLFEVPVIMTFIPRSLKSYDQTEPINRQIIVSLQLGRIGEEEEGPAEKVRIESWNVRKAKK